MGDDPVKLVVVCACLAAVLSEAAHGIAALTSALIVQLVYGW